ncbi:MAG: hypothetical protein CMG71_01920 [Candidatus Marinimicrobia bacterium]|nr:hypothetical protein [Candidatus Neomarinimicrobiota bacterium]
MQLKRIIIIFSLIVMSMAEIACEDDPILQPQTGKDEEKGSYGHLFLHEQKDSVNTKYISNPEIY